MGHFVGNFDVKKKLGLLIVLAILMLGLVGGIGLVSAWRLGGVLSIVSEERLPTANRLSTIRNAMANLRAVSLETLLWRDKRGAQSSFRNIGRKIDPIFKELSVAVDQYGSVELEPDEAKAWDSFKRSYTRWLKNANQTAEVIGQLASIKNGGDEAEVAEQQKALFKTFDATYSAWNAVDPLLQNSLKTLVMANTRSGDESVETGQRVSRTAVVQVGAIFAAAIVLLIALGFVLARRIVKPLDSMRRSIVLIASEYDFTSRVAVATRDEAGQTALAFNGLVEQIQCSLRDVLDSATRISDTAHQASEVARHVSDASDSQAESASSMAAAVEEMTVSISHINDSVKEALQRARAAGLAADSGAGTIARSHAEMSEIARTVQHAAQELQQVGVQSGNISMMVQIIKDVAEQTNLLALNAAIEAARAGEQGRGFAVVADEVRKLAERTAASTSEISKIVDLMQSSTRNAILGMESVAKRVETGNELSGQAAGSIKEIQGGSKLAADAINDISDALTEQSSTAQEIARRVETVARMGEENTAASKNVATVAASLDELAAALRQTVGGFRV